MDRIAAATSIKRLLINNFKDMGLGAHTNATMTPL